MASAENKAKAQALKEKANTAYGKKDYTEALKLYSAALKLDPENHILLSNRSVTHYQMKNYVLAIMDALHARKIDQSWLKASYHEGIAALAMKRYLQAKEAFKRCLELEPGHASALEMLNTAETEHISAYYDTITAPTKLRILYKGLVRGKGVFTKAPYKRDECILTEVPLVSHMHVAMLSKDTEHICSHCLSSHLPESVLSERPALRSALYKIPPAFVRCPLCHAPYCSRNCRDIAWVSYHAALCTKGSSDHPLAKLYDFARKHDKTSPLLIARMFATMCQQAREFPGEPEKPLQPFFGFASHEETSFGDADALNLIKEALAADCDTSMVTLPAYRRLHSTLRRNASDICTMSDLHLLCLSPDQQNQELVRNTLGFPRQAPLTQLLGSPLLKAQAVDGTGLFAIANTCNHSCVPNAALVSADNSHKLQIRALRDIKEGEELLVSYINEDLPYAERQKMLQELWRFTCTCEKCTEQAKK